MIQPSPKPTRTYTLFPYTTLFRSPRPASAGRAGTGRRDLENAHRPQGYRWTPPAAPREERPARRSRRRSRAQRPRRPARKRSEEHTSELQSLMRISYAVFCLKKKKRKIHTYTTHARTTSNYL